MKSFFLIMLSVLLFACNNTGHEKKIRSQSDYFEAVSKNDVKLTTPKEGEWLFEHKEKGQTFAQYKQSLPVRPASDKAIIYLQPVGSFTELQQEVLRLTRDYIEIFFQRKTLMMPALADKPLPEFAARQREDKHLQLYAPYILDSLLNGHAPKDALALLAISAKDLYHKNDWNFVFGLASYTDRVGVSSIYRLQNKQLDTSNFRLCLTRLINVASHEIGHMISMQHCTFARCVMNGSNSLPETDLVPNRLCSDCQKKLSWNFEYDNRKRLTQLNNYFSQNGLKRDLGMAKRDLEQLGR